MASEDGNVSDLWHRRLGHPSESVMKNMVDKVAMDSKIPKEVKLSFCESCVEGKMQPSHSSQQERFIPHESCSVYIVMYVGQCLQSPLEGNVTL